MDVLSPLFVGFLFARPWLDHQRSALDRRNIESKRIGRDGAEPKEATDAVDWC